MSEIWDEIRGCKAIASTDFSITVAKNRTDAEEFLVGKENATTKNVEKLLCKQLEWKRTGIKIVVIYL